MRRLSASLLLRVALGSMLLLGVSRLHPPAASAAFPLKDEPLVIIVNKNNPVANLTYAELRQFFLAERGYWPQGRKTVLTMREMGQPERAAVLRQIYRMNESDYNRHFLQLNYAGESQATPKQLATAEKMRKFVFNVPGAIGYVRLSEMDDTVKLIRIDGLAPGDAGYKLPSSDR